MKTNCPFCDRRNFEDRIIWEDDCSYLIATLGQITDGGYLLLIPKIHIPCIGSASTRYAERVDTLEKKIIRALNTEYNSPVTIFEHGIAGQTVEHAHIHFLPAEGDVISKIRKKSRCRKEINSITSWKTLTSMYRAKQKHYLLWRNENQFENWKTIIWDPSFTPPQFLRTVFAEAFGRPERANWRNVNPETDWKLIQETVRRMHEYFL